tara:strand:+ start:199 stop:438 length:240 start_codon:yes stop_codon:yes gene_type:complete
MSNIIETNFGTLINPAIVAKGSASNIIKQGAFYVFSLRLSSEDVREYSFTNRHRAEKMRNILISHVEQSIKNKSKRVAN